MVEKKYEIISANKERSLEKSMTSIEDDKRVIDISIIKEGLLKLMLIKRYGVEPTKSELHRFIKFINVEYENNSSKNSFDKRVESICKQIDKKIEKFDKINHF